MPENKIRDLLEEYVSDRPTLERRKEIADSFRNEAKRHMLRPYVARAATTEGERPHALKLATDIQLDGLFKKIKKEIDGPDEALVVKYLFVTQDGGATEFLYDRWEEKSTDSDSYKMLTDSFVQYLVEFETVEKFYKYARKKGGDPAKILTATDIVMWQADAHNSASEPDIEEVWREFHRQSKYNEKTFPMGISEVDVVPVDEFHRTGRIRKVGKNYQLLPGATMEWDRLLDAWQYEVFFLKLRMRVMSGDGASVTIETETDKQGFDVRGGKWVPTRGATRTADVDNAAWEEIVIFCQYDPTVEGQVRKGVVTVENKLTVNIGQFNGRLTRIRVTAGEGSTIVFGNMHVQKQRGTKDPKKRR
jgi:hypothetical protein